MIGPLRIRTTALAAGVLLAFSLPAMAQMGQMGMGGGHPEGMMMGRGEMGERCEKCEKCQAPEPPKWLSTMTDDQKGKMNAMHLALGKEMGILSAKAGVKEAELKSLVTQDTPDKKAVRQKIDELTELKKEMMIKKYDHVMELRSILTPEQRTSFDMMFFGGMHGMGGGMMGGMGGMGGGMEHGMGGMGGGMAH